ncbi:MAG: type II toxin-antitoxin system antitoxin SocA domain-containing protein [bacterium]
MAILTQKQFGQRIQALREDAGVSQEMLARHLRITRQAVGQIENGKRTVDGAELVRLSEFFSVTVDALLKSPLPAKEEHHVQVQTHTFRFDANKLRNVLLYLLEKCGGKPNVGETVIYKLLYFIDFDAFELLGAPVTGISYRRLQFGPVPGRADFERVVKSMMQKDELKIFTHEYFGKPQKRYVALAEPNTEGFSVKEVEIVDKVIARLSDMNAAEIENYVHLDAPWMLTAEGGVIDYGLVVEREFPYAKRDYRKIWEGAAALDLISQLGPISREEAEYYEKL